MTSTTTSTTSAAMTSPTAPTQVPPTPRAAFSLRQIGWDSLYLLTAFPLGLAGFVLAVTGVSLGVSTLIIWIGVPILLGTLHVSGWWASMERHRLVHWLPGGSRQVRRPYRRPRPDGSWLRRTMAALADPQRWLDVAWLLIGFVTSTLFFCIAVTWWAGVLMGTTAWLWMGFLPENNEGLGALLGWGNTLAVEATLNTLIGLLFALTLPPVLRGSAWLHSMVGELFLNSRADLVDQVRQEQSARAAAQGAEAHSLRRLERDIHDGPQQRLVRLSMDLGRARRQLATDPEAAGHTVDEALQQARETLDELRALSRGIAPPLLVDRGLGVALDELAVRGAVPVRMYHALPAGVPEHVETAVYFTVSEALTNVAKHSGAAQAEVEVVLEGADLVLRVTDHGQGGAHPGGGSGLNGLAQRWASVGGGFWIDSPAGGPTVLTARVPLG